MLPENKKKKFSVGVAMSGGVDSSVTAALLQNMGYNVHGFFMELVQPDLERQIERVKTVATQLDIPLTVVGLTAEFKNIVLEYFTSSYFKGKTPNPCVLCNPRIKFGRFMEEILACGCDFMATGHYARIVRYSDDTYHLLRGLDLQKDQSYFLHRLTQEQLGKVLMPLGEQTKKNVYRMAAELGLAGLHGAESQDVCFLKNQDIHTFMAKHTADKSFGPIVNLEGKEMGRHKGIQYYTVGQRKGLGIPDATPYYVVALDPLQNAVIIGKKDALLKRKMSVAEINWLSAVEPDLPQDFLTRIRYRHKGAAAQVMATAAKMYEVRFHEPQLAVTPGQFAVFYREDEVIGGGVILR